MSARTVLEIKVEATLQIKLAILRVDIKAAQREYSRIQPLHGPAEELSTVLDRVNDLQIVRRRCLGTSTFEDRGDAVREARVTALESTYEQRARDTLAW
jgi:hypothetical protein